MASLSLSTRPNSDGSWYSINGTISHMGERKAISLGVKVPKKNYIKNPASDYIQGKSQEASDARTKVFKAKSILAEIEKEFINRNGVEPPMQFIIEEFKKHYIGEHKALSKTEREEKLREKARNDEKESRDLIYYIGDYIKTKKGLYSPHTIKNFETLKNTFSIFCLRYDYTCRVPDITNALLSKYLNFLCNDVVTETNEKGNLVTVKKRYENASAKKAITNLLTVVHYYEDDFDSVKISKKKILGELRVQDSRTGKKDDLAFISFEELLEFYSWDCSVYGRYQEEFEATRDCYVVSGLTGLRHSELYFVEKGSIQILMEPEPHKVLNITDGKNGHNTTTICPGLVEEILQRWSKRNFTAPRQILNIDGKKQTVHYRDCILPVRSTTKMNKRVHKLFHDIGWSQMKKTYGTHITPNNAKEFEPVGFWKVIKRVRYSGMERMEENITRHELLSFHSSRHTFACYLLKEGLPLKTISELLGHDSVKTTEDYYAQLLPQDVTYSASKLIESNKSLSNALLKRELMKVSA